MSTIPQPEITAEAQQAHAWKEELARKLASHRSRRNGLPPSMQSDLGQEASDQQLSRASRIAAAIANHYAGQPSYGEVLAQQAAAEARAASEAAEAARAAMEEAQRRIEAAHRMAVDAARVQAEAAASERETSGPAAPNHPRREPATVVLHEPIGFAPPAIARKPRPPRFDPSADADAARLADFDPYEEIIVESVTPLHAKLIEFPRELIAPRKARPRIAEAAFLAGPEPPLADCDGDHLRIFEVATSAPEDPAIALAAFDAPEATMPPAPEWSAIRLDSLPQTEAPRLAHSPASSMAAALYPASIATRLYAAAVDIAIISAAFAGFLAVFNYCTPQLPVGRPALIGAAAVYAGLWVLYQLLFFTFTDATPGMRQARIAFCTFADENPRRRMIRWRIAAMLLSACPLGIGLLWAWFDEDHLGWHDRISRIYQRSY